MSWPVIALGPLIEADGGVLQTGPFGSQLKQSEYTDDGVPVVMPKDIENGRVNRITVARVPETIANRLSRYRIRANGIVLPRRGTVTKRAFIGPDEEGWLCGTGCIKIEATGQRIWPKYLYYYLGTMESVDWLEKNAVGSTMLNLSTEIVSRFPLACPDIRTQEKIASVLTAYDDLIENNRRRIALLEEAARLLYREWFVHFRFPGHEHVKIIDGLPEGWERRTLGSILNLQRGFDLPVNKRVSGGIPVYGSTGIVGKHNVAKVDFPTLITGRSGSLGRVCYADDPCWPLNTSLWVTDFKAVSIYFAYFMLSAMDLAKFNAGASVPTLDRKVAHAVNVLVPTRDIATQFDKQMEVVFTQKKLLNKQIEKLAQARDLLLPRLMNGIFAV